MSCHVNMEDGEKQVCFVILKNKREDGIHRNRGSSRLSLTSFRFLLTCYHGVSGVCNCLFVLSLRSSVCNCNLEEVED